MKVEINGNLCILQILLMLFNMSLIGLPFLLFLNEFGYLLVCQILMHGSNTGVSNA